MNGGFGPPLDRPVKTPINRGLFQLYEATKDRLSSFGRPLAPRQALSSGGPMETERTATSPKATAHSGQSRPSQAQWSERPLTEALAQHSKRTTTSLLQHIYKAGISKGYSPALVGFLGSWPQNSVIRRLLYYLSQNSLISLIKRAVRNQLPLTACVLIHETPAP